MATPALVEADIRLGKELAEALLKDPVIKPKSLMWIYDESASEWRFLVATADARKRGPQAAYLRIRNVLKKKNLLPKIPLRRIVVADPSFPLIDIIGQCMKISDNSVAERSLLDCTFNGVFIPGAYIYVLNDQEVPDRVAVSGPKRQQGSVASLSQVASFQSPVGT